MKQTIQQLEIELAKVRDSHAGWVSSDELRRKEFAKAFNWYQEKNPYTYNQRELKIPSWTEIFVELGKILAAKDFRNLEGNVSDLEFKFNDLERMIKEIKI